MNAPLVSVVMPAFNAELYILDSVSSVLNQSFEDFELIVVDDNSTDQTLSLICEVAEKDPRVKVYGNRNPKGVAGAINTGIEVAKGKFIARADADDINRPYRLKMQVEYMQANNDCAILGGGYAPFNEQGHRCNIFHPSDGLEIAFKFIVNSFFCHPTVMIRKSVFDYVGCYPYVEAEDYAFFSNIVRKFQCHNLRVILIDYRESLQNRSFSARSKIEESVYLKSKENFKYYGGDESLFDEYYYFYRGGRISFSAFIGIVKLNSCFITKISQNYKLYGSGFYMYAIIVRLLLNDVLKFLRRY